MRNISALLQSIRKPLRAIRHKESPETGPVKQRTVIAHNHLFKNAGSTIDWTLLRNFGDGFVDHRDDAAMKSGGSDYLRGYIADNSWIQAISSHHLVLPLPVLENTCFLTIMMFRHPIERVTSVYKFERAQVEADTLGARFAREHSLREYVLWRMRPDVPPTIRNFHVHRTPPFPDPGADYNKEERLARAKSYIESVELLGLVERFDESMVLFEETLRPIFPDIDLAYRIQNVGQEREKSKDIRIERLKGEIGEDAFSLLETQNAADLELYEWAVREIEARLARVSNMQERLRNFRERCCGEE